MLGVEVLEDDLVTEMDHLTSLLVYVCSELFEFGLGSRGGFGLFGLIFLGVHLIIDFEGTLGQNFEQGFPIVVDVDHITAHGRQDVLGVVYLEVEVRVGITEWSGEYDLVVRKVLGFSSDRIRMICPYFRFDIGCIK